MVEKISVERFRCELPGCGRSYSTRRAAEECEGRGQREPRLEQGDVLRERKPREPWEADTYVVLGSRSKGHGGTYRMARLKTEDFRPVSIGGIEEHPFSKMEGLLPVSEFYSNKARQFCRYRGEGI